MAKFELSHAYPFMSLNFVLVLLLAGLLFHEPLSTPKVVGVTNGTADVSDCYGDSTHVFDVSSGQQKDPAGDSRFQITATLVLDSGVWKVSSNDSLSLLYPYTYEYEVLEFNLGNTFNHAEMASLLAPRPFMVERGHEDGVAPDEWVAYEYAKVRRFYTRLGIPDHTESEFFNGPHTIHGVGTFAFLRRHLQWPR